MSSLTLVIGNKNYSSWSLRPWLALRHFGIPFQEKSIALFQGDFKKEILSYSPAGKVPILLLQDGTPIWDSLAIGETLAELYPEKPWWPADPVHRAQARSAACEMHSGFADLRKEFPMNLRRTPSAIQASDKALSDISRIQQLWNACLSVNPSKSGFLFGEFGLVDAMYAPVIGRFKSYAVPVSPIVQDYMDRVWSLPAMQEWLDAAKSETQVVAASEK